MTTYSFDFLRYRTVCLLFSIAIFAMFIGTYIYRVQTRGYAFTYSVDFTGGTQILFKFNQPIDSEQLKTILDKAGWPGAILREFSKQETLVRIKEHAGDITGTGERMRQAIEAASPGNKVTILQTDSVGAGISEDLRWKSIRVVLLGLLIMLLYIAWRFWSVSYGLGAIVALFHDAIVILATFLLLDKEISINVIGAILLILGYSINDTIVIFARIRDNVKANPDKPLDTVVNASLNQTLTRTTLTSLSTALVVVSLMLFGGETLRDLSLALLIGIIFGTYSSIYIASPIMMYFSKRKNEESEKTSASQRFSQKMV